MTDGVGGIERSTPNVSGGTNDEAASFSGSQAGDGGGDVITLLGRQGSAQTSEDFASAELTAPHSIDVKLGGDTLLAGPIEFLRGVFGGDGGTRPAAAQTRTGDPVQTVNSLAGLESSGPGGALQYAPGDEAPKSDDLDAGVYGLTGIEDEGGVIRRFFTQPTLQQNTDVYDRAKEGTRLKAGDVLYRLENTEIDDDLIQAEGGYNQAVDNLPSTITQAKTEALGQRASVQGELARLDQQGLQIDGDIARVDADISQIDAGLAGLDSRIANQELAVASAEASVESNRGLVDRIDDSRVVEEGAFSSDGYIDRTDRLEEAEQNLQAQENALIELRNEKTGLAGQRDALVQRRDGLQQQKATVEPQRETLTAQLEGIADLAALTPEQAIERVRADDTADLPPSVVAAANTVLTAEKSLVNARKAKESLTIRTPIDGIVNQQLPEGLRFNLLDGSVALNNSTGTDLGALPEDPERIRDGEGNDGQTPSVIPDPEQQASISIQGVSPKQAEQFEIGETVAFRTSDGELGYAQVYFNLPDSDAGGHKIKLENARYADGTELTLAERRPIQVYADAAPDLYAFGSTENTVSLTPPGELIDIPGEFPVAEQEFDVRVPVFADAAEGEEAEIVAYVNVSGTTRTNGRKVQVIQQKAWITAVGSTTSVPVDVDVSVAQVSTGSNSAGAARLDSGVRLEVAVPFIEQNGSIAVSESETRGGSGGGSVEFETPDSIPLGEIGEIKIPQIKGSGSISRQGSETEGTTVAELPPSQQLRIPINIAPTGNVHGEETIRIHTPSAVKGNVPANLSGT